MTELLYTRDDGDWEIVQELHVRSGGVWRKVLEAWVRDAGVWKRFHRALLVNASPLSIVGTRVGGGQAETNATTATAEGGSGSYTFVWEIVSQVGDATATLSPTSGPTTVAVATFASGGEQVVGVIKCVVTDTVTGLSVDSPNISFTLASL
jgi:hypothetical protein